MYVIDKLINTSVLIYSMKKNNAGAKIINNKYYGSELIELIVANRKNTGNLFLNSAAELYIHVPSKKNKILL